MRSSEGKRDLGAVPSRMFGIAFCVYQAGAGSGWTGPLGLCLLLPILMVVWFREGRAPCRRPGSRPVFGTPHPLGFLAPTSAACCCCCCCFVFLRTGAVRAVPEFLLHCLPFTTKA